MSKKEKLIARLRQKPRDFTWRELVRLLHALGYAEVAGGKTGGSRRKFVHASAPTIYVTQASSTQYPETLSSQTSPCTVRKGATDMTDTMEHKGYHGSVHYSHEDRVFYGKVLFIRSLVSFEGTDIESLNEAFEEAVDDYLELCEQQGKTVEQPFRGRFQVRTPSDVHRRAALLAREKGVNLSDVVTEALEAYLSTQPVR